MNFSEIRLHTPQTLNEALELSVKIKEPRFLAGGTDLLVDIKQGLLAAKDIISLQKLKELKGIKKINKEIQIGALVTPKDILSDSLINRDIPALADAARSMASTQIRAVATIGGNISSAVPSADLPPPLIAAEASVRLQRSRSFRKVSLSKFFRGPRETVCKTGELLTFILIPLLPPGTGIFYQKFALREASALAVASVASRVTLKEGKINRAAVVLGAVAPTPILALKASEFLINREPSQDTFEKAALLAKEEAEPISDIRGSIWYRKELIRVLTQRTLSEALERAQGKNRKKK